MTTGQQSAPTETSRRGAGVTWARVEDGFHVASRAGDFLGYVDRHADGRYLAYDAHSRRIGAFADLTSGMRAVVGGAEGAAAGRGPR